MTWADEIRTLQVRTNADTPADALNAVKFGARVLDFAVQSICSLMQREFQRFVV